MGLLGGLYRGVFKRTSTFTAAICVGAIGVSNTRYTIIFSTTNFHSQFERGFDALADYVWETNNKGKLWKDIKHKYENAE